MPFFSLFLSSPPKNTLSIWYLTTRAMFLSHQTIAWSVMHFKQSGYIISGHRMTLRPKVWGLQAVPPSLTTLSFSPSVAPSISLKNHTHPSLSLFSPFFLALSSHRPLFDCMNYHMITSVHLPSAGRRSPEGVVMSSSPPPSHHPLTCVSRMTPP